MKVNLKGLRRWFYALGVALAFSGYFRFATQGLFTSVDEGLLIAGAVLILLAVVLSYQEILGFFGHRSAKLGANTAVLTLLTIVILGLLNYIGYRHDKSVDLTTEGLYTLSDETHRVLNNVNENIQVILFAQGTDQGLHDLVQAYQAINPHVHYELIDPQAQPQVAQQYNITQLGKTVVTDGTHTETLDTHDEEDLTDAILKLTRNTVKTICFVEGHGEKSISAEGDDSLSSMAHVLAGQGDTTKSVNLVSADAVPSDCNALVDAGPKQAFFPQETAMVAKYLDGGGKVLLMIDPETDPKLGDILDKWNVKVGNNVVVDASGVGRLFGTGPAVPLVVNYGDSPITRNFSGSMTFFPLARTVTIANPNATTPTEVELLKTSDRAFTVPNMKVKEVHFDPAVDQAGPLNLGVSAEQKEGTGPDAKQARLVVFGNSAFATNQWSGLQRDGDLFLNTINWLAQDESLISIRPKVATARRVIITDTQSQELNWATLIFLPGIVVIAGVVLWARRR